MAKLQVSGNIIPKAIKNIAKAAGGKVEDLTWPLPDGSGFVIMSTPLPKDHWLTKEGYNVPPMPFKKGTDDPERKELIEKIKEAARYAIRSATDNGKIADFDPDAMVQNFIIGMLGYNTPDALSSIER
jgi:hypothetical protein